MNCSKILEAELIGAVSTVPHTRFFHAKPPLKATRPPPANRSSGRRVWGTASP
jgi:hypothetical protein